MLTNTINNPKEAVLMGHIVAGFPNYQASLQAALGIARGGAAYLEIQFPFSDPNADGPTIAQACDIALQNGFHTECGFTLIKELKEQLKKEQLKTKLLIMTYANIAYAYGLKAFIKKAKKCNVYGLIIPDLSLQNDEGLFLLCKRANLQNIALIAPYTTDQRMHKLSKASGDFVYVVARNGITGANTTITQEILHYLKRIKLHCKKPLALGFGIQNKEQIKALRHEVQIIVIGSAFVREIHNTKDNLAHNLERFTQNLLAP